MATIDRPAIEFRRHFHAPTRRPAVNSNLDAFGFGCPPRPAAFIPPAARLRARGIRAACRKNQALRILHQHKDQNRKSLCTAFSSADRFTVPRGQSSKQPEVSGLIQRNARSSASMCAGTRNQSPQSVLVLVLASDAQMRPSDRKRSASPAADRLDHGLWRLRILTRV